jgi:hypothetical protein
MNDNRCAAIKVQSRVIPKITGVPLLLAECNERQRKKNDNVSGGSRQATPAKSKWNLRGKLLSWFFRRNRTNSTEKVVHARKYALQNQVIGGASSHLAKKHRSLCQFF